MLLITDIKQLQFEWHIWFILTNENISYTFLWVNKHFIPDVVNQTYLLIIINNHTRRFFIHKPSTSSRLPERAPNLTSVRPMYLGKRELLSYLICSLHNYILLWLSPSPGPPSADLPPRRNDQAMLFRETDWDAIAFVCVSWYCFFQ